MIKKFLIAAALVIASPALVFSQDIFISFERDFYEPSVCSDGTPGTAYILSDEAFAFDALDLEVTSSDSSVILLTGGTGFNGEYVGNPFISGVAFNSTAVTIIPDANSGDRVRLFATNITTNGIIPAAADFYTEFEAGGGSSGGGGFVLAEITYDVIGSGVSNLELNLGVQGALSLPMTVLDPTFGSGEISVTFECIPEPSSATLLVLGSIGLITRRKRA